MIRAPRATLGRGRAGNLAGAVARIAFAAVSLGSAVGCATYSETFTPVEQKLAEMKAPYTPGRLPNWNRE